MLYYEFDTNYSSLVECKFLLGPKLCIAINDLDFITKVNGIYMNYTHQANFQMMFFFLNKDDILKKKDSYTKCTQKEDILKKKHHKPVFYKILSHVFKVS